MKYTTPQGMRYEYSYRGLPNSAFFAYGSSSIVYTIGANDWINMSEQERHKWRQAKYAQALKHFNLTRS